MSDPQLAAYLVLAALIVITPGAATALVVRNVLEGGRRRGLATAAGLAIANTSYAALSTLGLAAVLARSPRALVGLSAAGAGYLAFLGVRSLRLAWRGRPPAAASDAVGRAPSGRAPGAMRNAVAQGVATNLLSPAMATFYLAVVPSFLDGAPVASARYAALAALHVTMALAYHSAWALALHAMRSFWSRPTQRRALEALTGAALLLLAARLAGAL